MDFSNNSTVVHNPTKFHENRSTFSPTLPLDGQTLAKTQPT